MKKFIGFIIVLNALLLFGFTNMVSANDKVEATIASIIQSKININDYAKVKKCL